jgi:DNA-binding phage protein
VGFYKALSPAGNPILGTALKVVMALGIWLTATAA